MGQDPMDVEIWSDVACPFCWLGKRRFDLALAELGRPDGLRVRWRSYQLNPSLRTDPELRVTEWLARAKGIDVATARQLNDRIARMGRHDGLAYDFDRVVVANTFDAHRLIQLAHERGVQDEIEERLFRANFAEGRNVADRGTLLELGADVGLAAEEVAAMLTRDAYAAEVRADMDEARRLGVGGVPFFLFDRTHAVSGAQDIGVFVQALERAP